ncbi:hypothetical protein P885DRAFT_43648 [Corynascus similis CBS 632.67]
MSSNVPYPREDPLPNPSNAGQNDTTKKDNSNDDDDAVAAWQTFMNNGRNYLARRRLEQAAQAFASALALCDNAQPSSLLATRRFRSLGDLGWTYRLTGRYPEALAALAEALRLADSLPDPEQGRRSRARVFVAGEVGTVLMLLGRFEEAKKRFEEQAADAQRLGKMEGALCRALGGLGAVRYLMALRVWDTERGEARRREAEGLVRKGMDRLVEGQELAEKIQRVEEKRGGHGPSARAREATEWEVRADGRLSLCYTLLADMMESATDRRQMMDKAEAAAERAVRRAEEWYLEGSILPMSQFFYGRALLRRGKKDLALEQFNPKPTFTWRRGVVTPCMAMCKEPSEEHRSYLREMVKAGADLDVFDSDGYTALDHAVFSGDAESQDIVSEGLKRQLRLSDAGLAARRTEAYLRKGYREILQDKLRPILYRDAEDADCIKQLRREYAQALAADPEKEALFDRLKYIRYADFKRFGRLPRSSDGLVRSFHLEQPGEENELGVLLFFSYRWINEDRSLNTPDDPSGTQYLRMVHATELYLQQNPDVEEDKLCIWMDFACVDQDNPGTGVSALPLMVTQCDAVISLVDETYYERAWCCVEAMMISELDVSFYEDFSAHRWLEHMPFAMADSAASTGETGDDRANATGGGKWTLQKARRLALKMQDKKLTYEQDRPKVMFLERQSRLLGRLRY